MADDWDVATTRWALLVALGLGSILRITQAQPLSPPPPLPGEGSGGGGPEIWPEKLFR